MKVARRSSVEGRFYPLHREQILRQLEEVEKESRYPLPSLKVKEVYGAVLPHAGHVYSAAQALPVFQMLRAEKIYPDTFVIVHPRHRGHGPDLALDPHQAWANSLGEVPLDHELGRSLGLPYDESSHDGEHSAEVLLPYLQHFMGNRAFSILPVCMGKQGLEEARKVAAAISQARESSQKNILVLASSDFTHFQSPMEGRRRDQAVLDAILQGRPAEVEAAVHSHHASVCGYGPIMALMIYSQLRNAEARMKVLARGHSGEVHPSPEVVDYISILSYR